jgi:hypothetical protein
VSLRGKVKGERALRIIYSSSSHNYCSLVFLLRNEYSDYLPILELDYPFVKVFIEFFIHSGS